MWLKSKFLIIVFITIIFLLVSGRSEARQNQHANHNSNSKHNGNGAGHGNGNGNGNGNDFDDYDDDDDSLEGGTKAELEKIDFLLQVMFNQDSFSSQCESKAASRINARDCLIGLAYGLASSRPYSCEFFQGEYDCFVYSLQGCFDRALDLQRFYQLQADFAHKYNCTIDSNRDSQSPIDEYRPRKGHNHHGKPKSKSHSNGNGSEHHSMHRPEADSITITTHNDSDSITKENSKDDLYVIRNVLSTAGFYFVWL